MKNMYVTIFTPTYNRGYIIEKLYNSLIRQTNKSFVWLVVDDGSDDDTESLIKAWKEDKIIDLIYLKQENSGKHIAYNTAIRNCNTELFFCVDSDDYLLENAINDILVEYEGIKSNDSICGIASSRFSSNNQPMYGVYMPEDVNYSNLSDLYEKYKFRGETSLVFKYSVIKNYKYPNIEGEKFIGEEYIYCQLDKNYKFYLSKKAYYICEYLDDGYTRNMYKLIYDNPRGYFELKKMKLKCSCNSNFLIKYKQSGLYIVASWLSGNKKYIINSPDKIMTIFAIPLAIIIYIIRFEKYRRFVKKP